MDFKAELQKLKELLSEERNRMYVISAATLAFSVFYLSFVIIPKTSEIARMARTVSDLKDNIKLVEGRAKKLDEMSAKLEALKKEQAGYAKQLPAEKEIPGLLEGLAAMALKSGVNIQSITPQAMVDIEVRSTKDVYYREMPLLLTAKSGYHQLGEFLGNLEGASRFITIETLRIQYDTKTPRAHNIRMVLKTYVSVGDENYKRK